MNKRILTGVLLLFIASGLYAQDGGAREKPRPVMYYIGLEPAVHVEPYDALRNTVDINIIPLLLEYAINRHWGIRLNPVIDLQLRPELPSAFSRMGAGITVPYYFSKKNNEEGHRGFYSGPSVIVLNHRLNKFFSTTLGAEVGYSFIFSGILSVNVGAQAGLTMNINPENNFLQYYLHRVGKISFGIWF